MQFCGRRGSILTLLRFEVADDEVSVVESVDLSGAALLLLLKLYVKLLAPLELLSLPRTGWAELRLCRMRQYDEFVDFNFDMNSSPDSLLSSGEQFATKEKAQTGIGDEKRTSS